MSLACARCARRSTSKRPATAHSRRAANSMYMGARTLDSTCLTHIARFRRTFSSNYSRKGYHITNPWTRAYPSRRWLARARQRLTFRVMSNGDLATQAAACGSTARAPSSLAIHVNMSSGTKQMSYAALCDMLIDVQPRRETDNEKSRYCRPPMPTTSAPSPSSVSSLGSTAGASASAARGPFTHARPPTHVR